MLEATRTEKDPALRRQAVQLLGAMGAQAQLWAMYQAEADPQAKKAALQALAVSGDIDRIVDVARSDKDVELRRGGCGPPRSGRPRRSTALDDDPEIEVKKKAVFALSQLPKDEGLPLLIGVAKSHQSYEVRKQAMFRLGQSDPRALAFFEDVLKR